MRRIQQRSYPLLSPKLSETAFTTLYCTVVQAHLESVVEANSPNLIVDCYKLERVHLLTMQLVKGLHHSPMRKGFENLTLSRL